MEKARHRHVTDDKASPVKLREIGVTPKQSSRWQQSAKVPEPEFQSYVEQSTASGKEITSAGL
ncbi:MAG TPA: hypothetical protein VG796_10660 [Verrucomicrobiales bacterium]|nr:hypothetical protein [Verrucomicrobiales bacterium]